MARTLAQLVDTVEQAVVGATDTRLGAVAAINEAGHFLCASAEWGFLRRPEISLSLTANQPYIALPSDFASLVALNTYSATLTAVHVVAADHIQRLRASQLQSSLDFYAAVEWPTQESVTSVASGPRLVVWPTPGASTANAMRMIYRAGWVEMSDMSAYPNIPADMETWLVELARAIAQGRRASGDTTPARLESIVNSLGFQRMVARYGRVQPTLGPMIGGAAQCPDYVVYRPFTSIPDPA